MRIYVDPLLAETVPDGTFGHALPPRPAQGPVDAPTWSPVQQAQHRADLLAALNNWAWDEDTRGAERRHLRLINDQNHTDAA